MGGGYYDRPVVQAEDKKVDIKAPEVQKKIQNDPRLIPKPYSKESEQLLAQNTSLHKNMNPQRFTKEDNLVSEDKNPIVFALDVTGNGMADKAPLQVTEFGKGKEIDQLISKMFLEDGGGANHHESYELAAYFYNEFCELKNSELPFMFITGDEKFFEKLPAEQIQKFLGVNMEETVPAKSIWEKLTKKFNVFLLHKRYYKNDAEVIKEWGDAIGEDHVFQVTEPKACIDIILGTIAITSGIRTLETYCQDLKEREQTEERIQEVRKALQNYDKNFKGPKVGKIVPSINVEKNEKAIEKGNFIEEVRKEILPRLEKTSFFVNNNEKINEYIKLQKSKDAPKEFLCPIREEIMLEPVQAEDGNIYEKEALSIWLSARNESPMTGAPMKSKDFVEKIDLKKQITEFYQANQVADF